MIELVQKEGIYAQYTGQVNRWYKYVENAPSTLPGRNIGIEIKENNVNQICILHLVREEPTNGEAALTFLKLEKVNNLGEWASIKEVYHRISKLKYVNELGEIVDNEEAMNEDRSIKEGYTTDYDYYDNLFNRSNNVVREDAIRDFMEKIFVTIPNSI
jgi:hypothetical protein